MFTHMSISGHVEYCLSRSEEHREKENARPPSVSADGPVKRKRLKLSSTSTLGASDKRTSAKASPSSSVAPLAPTIVSSSSSVAPLAPSKASSSLSYDCATPVASSHFFNNISFSEIHFAPEDKKSIAEKGVKRSLDINEKLFKYVFRLPPMVECSCDDDTKTDDEEMECYHFGFRWWCYNKKVLGSLEPSVDRLTEGEGVAVVIRSGGATMRDAPDIDTSSVVGRLASGALFLFTETLVLPAPDDECVPVTRLRGRPADMSAHLDHSGEIWVSLTGRTVDDHAPILEILSMPTPRLQQNQRTEPSPSVLTDRKTPSILRAKSCPLCDMPFERNVTLSEREGHLAECCAWGM